MSTYSAKEPTASPRIIIRYMNLTKANQVEEFPLDRHEALTIGREPSCEIKFDAERDDLVSRRHARIDIQKKDGLEVTLTDLGSRNNTFVNKQRIETIRLNPSDVVQLGIGGPEFQFDVEPRPEKGPPPTKLGAMVPKTREGGSLPTSPGPAVPLTASTQPRSLGAATVERLIHQNRKLIRSYALAGGLVLMLAVAGGLALLAMRKPTVIEKAVPISDGKLDPTAIAQMAAPSVVLIEVSWKLVDTTTGSQLYHFYQPAKINDQAVWLPAFVQLDDGKLEPVLTTESNRGLNRPIGSEPGMSGTGFVIGRDGFILTNRHVAAAWNTRYDWPNSPGCLLTEQGGKSVCTPFERKNFPWWVPASAQAFHEGNGTFVRSRMLHGKAIEGRNDVLDVTFTRDRIRIPAKIARISDRHDVAMIKIDVPRSLEKLEVNDKYDSIRQGAPVVVMGYPGAAAHSYAETISKDVFNPNRDVKVFPEPTFSFGNIGRIAASDGSLGDRSGQVLHSDAGDLYQLTINSTGSGNSGGPVLDMQGRVIAIFSARNEIMSFAVPIKYGAELTQVGK